jgi:hypothetical protein
MHSSSQLRLVVPGESVARHHQAAAAHRAEQARRRHRQPLRLRVAAVLIGLGERLAAEQSPASVRSA